MQFGHVMLHKGGRELLSVPTLAEGQHHKLEAAVHPFKNSAAVLKTEQAHQFRLLKQHAAQSRRAQIGVDAAGNDRAAQAAFAKQVVALFGEQLVKVEVAAGFAAIDNGGLVLVLRRAAIIGALVREAAQIIQPGGANFRLLQQFCLPLLKLLNPHLVLCDHIGIVSKKLLRLRLPNLPRRVGNDSVKAAALIHHRVKLVAPMKRLQGGDVGQLQRAFFRFALLLLLAVPRRLLILNAQSAKLIQQNLVQRLLRLLAMLFNILAHLLHIIGQGTSQPVAFHQPFLFFHHLPIGTLPR